ncbi:hypothetical protein WJX73_010056 [Symbiochloris irregularis]|uniref:Uncharacterized protein n=1 Tax=Symbiochloris irregularis TaxID=706552 RepID=A0AAW1NL49_9CHLO
MRPRHAGVSVPTPQQLASGDRRAPATAPQAAAPEPAAAHRRVEQPGRGGLEAPGSSGAGDGHCGAEPSKRRRVVIYNSSDEED